MGVIHHPPPHEPHIFTRIDDLRQGGSHHTMLIPCKCDRSYSHHTITKGRLTGDKTPLFILSYRDDSMMVDEFQEGMKLFQKQQYEEALAHFKKATEEDGNNPKAWNAMGATCTKLGYYDIADGCYDNALMLDPGNTTYESNRDKNKGKLTPLSQPVPTVPPPPQYGSAPKYQSNILLFIWPFLGAWLCAWWRGIGGLLFIFSSSIFIYSDADKIKADKIKAETYPSTFDAITWKPWEWGVITFFFWIIGYPLYLYKRRAIYETKNNLQRTSTSPVKLLAGVIGFFIILAIIFYGLVMARVI